MVLNYILVGCPWCFDSMVTTLGLRFASAEKVCQKAYKLHFVPFFVIKLPAISGFSFTFPFIFKQNRENRISWRSWSSTPVTFSLLYRLGSEWCFTAWWVFLHLLFLFPLHTLILSLLGDYGRRCYHSDLIRLSSTKGTLWNSKIGIS